VLSLLNLHDRVDISHEDRAREKWTAFVRQLRSPRKRQITLGLTGKYAALQDAYASIGKALEHCAAHLSCQIDIRWIDTTDVSDGNVTERLTGVDAVIVPGGFGVRGIEGKIACAKYCRENNVPYLGICLGFQVAVMEFARNVCGLADASSTEFDRKEFKTPHPVISELPEQKKIEGLGGTMRLGAQDVAIKPGTLAHFLYGSTTIRERFRHRYEVDPAYIARLEAGGMVFSGRHPRQPIMQILELPQSAEPGAISHPFFIGGQFHPELTSRPLRPQPLFMGLVAAAIAAKFGADSTGDATVGRLIRTIKAPKQTV
jgi:CTP synthase